MMPDRIAALHMAYQGLLQTHVPLTAIDQGKLIPAGFSDDLGIYYLIPKLMLWLGIPENQLEKFATIFFHSILIFSALVGFIAIMLLFKSKWLSIIAAIIVFFATKSAWITNDVYVFSLATVMLCIPWTIYLLKFQHNLIFFLLFLFGLLLGVSHYFRSYSDIPVIAFIVSYILLAKLSVLKKIFMYAAFFAAYAYVILSVNHIIDIRDSYLAKHIPDYHAPIPHHSFWHPVYLGLGYLPNPYGIAYDDKLGLETALMVDPQVKIYSDHYNEILKQKFFNILKTDPVFFLKNVFYKIITIILHQIVYIIPLLILSLLDLDSFDIDLSFIIAISIAILPGILVVPYKKYLLSFYALISLYFIYKLAMLINMIKLSMQANTNGLKTTLVSMVTEKMRFSVMRRLFRS